MKNLFENIENEPDQKQNDLVGQAVRHVLDVEYKKQLAERLSAEYNISKTNTSAPRIINFSVRKIILAAASLMLIAVAFFLLRKPTMSPQQYALHLVDKYPIAHPGNTKGVVDQKNIRAQAIAAYQDREFDRAGMLFSQVDEPSLEDQYFLALSSLYEQKYDEAEKIFLSILKANAGFQQESRYFLGLSSLLANKNDDAMEILGKIEPGDWKYEEATTLIQKMK